MGYVNGAGFGAIACTTTGKNASVRVVASSSHTQLGLGSASPEQTPQLATALGPGSYAEAPDSLLPSFIHCSAVPLPLWKRTMPLGGC